MKEKYVHTEEIHNLEAPRQIVPEIIRMLGPASVVDIGCGIGTFLYCFKQEGVKDVLGIDGPWSNKELVAKYLGEGEFLEKDLEKEFSLGRKFDLVLSLEVAEHLSERSADTFVRNLIESGNVILFSAAIPLQGGQNHVNEQWLTYWERKFNAHGYVLKDVVRPIFWDNPKVDWWYKQNMVLFTPQHFTLDPAFPISPLRNVVHYDLFKEKSNYMEEFIDGRAGTWEYLKLLVKSFTKPFRGKAGT